VVALEQGADRLQPGVARLGVVLVTGRAQRQRDGQREEVLLARRPRTSAPCSGRSRMPWLGTSMMSAV
jgi:hypothetical protein